MSSSTPATARRGRVLHRPYRPATGRTADAEQRVKRGPLGPGIRTPWLHDGPVDAHPHQRLPGTQRVPGDHLIPRDDGQRRSSRAAGHGAQQRSRRPPPRGEGSENSDLTSDYGISFRQTQRDHPKGFESPETNLAPSAARTPVEHGFSDLKHWRILSRLRVDPGKATTVLRACSSSPAGTPSVQGSSASAPDRGEPRLGRACAAALAYLLGCGRWRQEISGSTPK
jgi:hypothetical protein